MNSFSCVMQSHVEEDVFFMQLRADWAKYLRGRTPFAKSCIGFRMECHCRLYHCYSMSCRLRVCRKVSDIFDESVEETLQEICAKFKENKDFGGMQTALDQLCRGSNSVGRTARSVYRQGHYFDLTEGFHRRLHHDESTKEGAALTVGDEIREEGARRLMPLAVAAYQERIRACLMSLHTRSGTSNIIRGSWCTQISASYAMVLFGKMVPSAWIICTLCAAVLVRRARSAIVSM